MKTLSKIYSDKETRNGIAVNKTYLVPVEKSIWSRDITSVKQMSSMWNISRSAGNQVSHCQH